MLIMPIVDFYAAASDWLSYGHDIPDGLFFFLAASFFNGIVIEVGRKMRLPEDEEKGVETYSVLWGRRKGALIWWGLIAATAICASLAAREVGAFLWIASLLGGVCAILGLIVLYCVVKRIREPVKLIEVSSGIWTLLLYLSLGILPGVLQ